SKLVLGYVVIDFETNFCNHAREPAGLHGEKCKDVYLTLRRLYMRKKCYKMAIFQLLFLLLCCQANAEMSLCPEKLHSGLQEKVNNKFYVEPGTVYVSPNEIMLNLSGNLLPIKALFSDSEGVFVLAEEIISAKAKEGVWYCAYCGEPNNGGNYCTTC